MSKLRLRHNQNYSRAAQSGFKSQVCHLPANLGKVTFVSVSSSLDDRSTTDHIELTHATTLWCTGNTPVCGQKEQHKNRRARGNSSYFGERIRLMFEYSSFLQSDATFPPTVPTISSGSSVSQMAPRLWVSVLRVGFSCKTVTWQQLMTWSGLKHSYLTPGS